MMPDWISVKDVLPDDDVRCLIAVQLEIQDPPEIRERHWTLGCYETGEQRYWIEGNVYPIERYDKELRGNWVVTHWAYYDISLPRV